jgi:phosphoribosylformylglycinamidine synthase subunit PurSL
VKPLTGVENDGPSDGCVLKPIGTDGVRGIALANGFNPEYGKRDAYNMAVSVIDEAIRNAVAVGADPDRIGILDNFCWGDPLNPETLGSLVQACRGCYDAAVAMRAPFISGKDSLNNEYLGADGKRHAIPPSLLISSIGMLDDVNQAVTMDVKEAGNYVYLLGETRNELGGSHLHLVMPQPKKKLVDFGGAVPAAPENALALYRALHQAMRRGVVRACHDLSEGGLAVAAAEMSLAGRFGMTLTLDGDDPVIALFSESNGRFLVEVRPADAAAFEHAFGGLLFTKVKHIGQTVADRWLTIQARNRKKLIALPIDILVEAWLGDRK